jgi:hypothetical protein
MRRGRRKGREVKYQLLIVLSIHSVFLSLFLSFSCRRDQLETTGIVQISLGNIESTINHNDLCATDYDREKDEVDDDDISRHPGSIIHSLSDLPA